MKVWGSLYFAKVIDEYWKSIEEYNTRANREFAQKHGFDFYDIMPQIEAQDRRVILELDNLTLEVFNEIKFAVDGIFSGSTQHLVFNGKTSFYLFTYFLLNDFQTRRGFTQHKRNIVHDLKQSNTNYGRVESHLVNGSTLQGQAPKNVYILPNTSSRTKHEFDEFVWIETLKTIKGNTQL
ncbi:MAG: hypothetical protein ACKO6L_06975 [Flavobacteriales bacterium]